MPVRKMNALRGIYWVAVVLATVAMVGAATPACAAGDEDYQGWFLTLDAALTQPTSLDQHFANHITFPGAGIDDQSERLVLDNDADLTGALKFGYGFGNGNGALQVSFWSFDNEDTIEDSLPGGVYPTLFGYGYYGGMYIYNSGGVLFRAKAKTKATTFDVDYLRSYAVGKKTTVTWLAGLRSATFEQIQDFDGYDGTYYYSQHKNFKSTALGLRLGAAVNFGFTEHFSLAGSTAFSFLQADTKGDSNQNFVDTDPSLFETNHGEDNNIRGEIRDYDLKAVWTYGKLDYFVGYSMSNWDGMVVDPVPANEGGIYGLGSMASRSRSSIAFNSLHAGVTFKFGGGK